MNREALFLLILLSISLAQVYTVDVDRSGLSTITVSLESGEPVVVPLPADASNIRIVGGSYKIENSAAFLTPGPSGFTSFSFSSTLLTSKDGSGWVMAIRAPEGSDVRVLMPSYTTFKNSTPSPLSISSEDSRTSLGFSSPNVTIHYKMEEPPTQAAQDQWPIYILAFAIVLSAVLVALSLRARPSGFQFPPLVEGLKQVNEPSLKLTSGKKEMMETFNENDLKIVSYLLKSEGKCRRNELERGSGISKSSLSMALNRLEKRKIIEIDRTSTTHFVKLSENFLRL